MMKGTILAILIVLGLFAVSFLLVAWSITAAIKLLKNKK
jgi:hypothetical protein